MNATEPGLYMVQWWGEIGPGIKPPLIIWQEVHVAELEECIQGWETMRLAWPAALAVDLREPGIWLELHGPKDDERQTVRCTVEGPSGTWQTDNTSVFMPAHQMGPRSDFRFLFPNHFPDGPGAPLERGEYRVLWEADMEGLGWQTICQDCFRVEGDILDCRGEKIEADPMLAE